MRISRRWWKDPKEWHARSDRLGRQVDRIGWVLSESELWIFFRAFDFCLVSYIWCHVWIVWTFWVGPTSGSFSNIYILWVVSLQELQKFCNAQLGRKMWIVKRIQRRFSILFFLEGSPELLLLIDQILQQLRWTMCIIIQVFRMRSRVEFSYTWHTFAKKKYPAVAQILLPCWFLCLDGP